MISQQAVSTTIGFVSWEGVLECRVEYNDIYIN